MLQEGRGSVRRCCRTRRLISDHLSDVGECPAAHVRVRSALAACSVTSLIERRQSSALKPSDSEAERLPSLS